MKRKLLILIGIIFLCSACTNKTYQEISLTTLEDKIKNEERFVIYIGSSTCSNCNALNPTLNEVIVNYNLTVYYIDVHNFTDAENETLLNLIDYENKTPRIYFITNGKHDNINMIKGNQTYETLVNAFKKYGYIKED